MNSKLKPFDKQLHWGFSFVNSAIRYTVERSHRADGKFCLPGRLFTVCCLGASESRSLEKLDLTPTEVHNVEKPNNV